MISDWSDMSAIVIICQMLRSHLQKCLKNNILKHLQNQQCPDSTLLGIYVPNAIHGVKSLNELMQMLIQCPLLLRM